MYIHFAYAISWNEKKRRSNLKLHGLDFTDCAQVFAGLTFIYEDDRLAYDERRFVTWGLLADEPVSIVHTEQPGLIRIISFRETTQK